MREEIPTSAAGNRVGLVRDLGLFDITMVGVGAMIGAGIFVLTGAGGPSAAEMYLGGGGIWTWITAGIFLVDLLGFTLLAWRAVDAQNRRRG